ncbi:Nebulin-related-anchoring protein [Larimichthys crocea]|uniref:Uncharacterized protein n=1 Tax=Larimichthys crocea TaxID=215358 RepID=A0ACD3RSB5_LARCR|nr:Nebulin-related-anchoring protein [Larimichthys crocea]
MKHNYTLSGELPEMVQAKINAVNLSESCYKESWKKLRDGGYKLRLDAIPFQSAKASGEILSDQKYKEEFEKSKGKMIGLKGLQDDLNIAHSVHANKLQSDIKYKQDSAKQLSKYNLSMDMMEVAHAKKAQSLVSDQDYKLTLHQYTSLPDDMKKKYRQQPYNFKHTSVADSPDIIHAKLSGQITNERLYKEKGVNDQHSYTITSERPEITQAKINAANFSEIKYKESWHTLRAQGYKLTMQDIPFQSAKSSTGIASDASGQYHLTPDMIHLVTAKNAQALASEQDYRKKLHEYTVLPDDMKVKWAKTAYNLQSEKLYKSDLNFMKGVAWDGVGAPQLESAKKAGELISDKKYRQLPDSLRFTSVTDSPDIVHAKTSYQQCSEVGRSFKVLRDTANIVDVCCDMTMTSCFRLYAAEIVQIWEE